MDIAGLEIQAQELLSKGVAPSTSNLSPANISRLLYPSPVITNTSTLILFVTELAQTRAHSTIRTYLAGVRHLHVTQGHGNPLSNTLKLDLVLKGIHRIKPNQKQPRLPVTPYILIRIKGVLDHSPSFESTMLWAACCTGFFGFLRCGEFMLPDSTSFDSTTPLGSFRCHG